MNRSTSFQSRIQTEIAGFSFFRGEEAIFRRLSRKFFGRILRSSELRGICGAPCGSVLQVGTLEDDIYIEYQKTDYPAMTGSCRLGREKSGLVLKNDSVYIFRKENRQEGIGLECFSRQVFWSKRLGINRIRTFGGRSELEIGYYVWPRYGFDALLPDSWFDNFPVLKGRTVSILDIMESPEGREFWREQGIPLSLTFDMSPNSRSSKALRIYIESIKIPSSFSETRPR